MDQANTRDEDQLFKRDEDQLLTARTILRSGQERRENSALYRWAKLVTERNAAGKPIADADAWYGQLAAGLSPEGI